MGKLSDMRKGIPNYKIVLIPGTEEKVALVQLNTKDIIESREKTIAYISEHPVDIDTTDLIFDMFVLIKAMRNPDNLEEHFVDSFGELQENTIPKQVYELHNKFLEVQNGMSDNIEEMTTEEFEDLKKKLNQIQLKECDGELQIILKYCLQTLTLRGLQMDK
ncbi:hypothetical protein [Wukongibacter sp. M2B1]|uniref:hypothetical protein n=1 Tax=Wukongibacter sp. M2B1 TaxID=3088895 RepID=UPI003D78C215